MGQPVSLNTEIEIARPPAEVRAVFLDFASWSEWHPDFTITPHAGKAPTELRRGDRLRNNLKGTVFNPVVQENTENLFRWRGSLYGLFVGVHSFHFTPSTATPGGTTLVQDEAFTGVLAFLMKPNSSYGKSTMAAFNKLNEDLKSRVESRNAS
jgi:hypothetical protein